jgi:hypothetical protein
LVIFDAIRWTTFSRLRVGPYLASDCAADDHELPACILAKIVNGRLLRQKSMLIKYEQPTS